MSRRSMPHEAPTSEVVARKGRTALIASATVFIVAQVVVVMLGFAGMGVSNVARAYVTGEAQYSKAQKEAVIALERYSHSGAEGDYRLFESSLDVLRGDRAARQALEARSLDVEAARQGFLRGRNDPADIPFMIMGFRLFSQVPSFARAVADWRAADVQFLKLQTLGVQIRAAIVHRTAPDAFASELSEADRLDRTATPLEQTFSVQMGIVARQATDIAYVILAGVSVTACILGLMLTWTILRDFLRISGALIEAKDRAEAGARVKADFLANMSHEIRTPLNGIIGFAGLLEGVEGLPEQARTNISRINTSSHALLSVVNDILDYSKMEAGEIELDPQAFDPAAFVVEALALVEAQAHAKGIALAAEIDADMPAGISADAARLRQILLNLLTNAIKFTTQGQVTVKARYLAGAELLRVEVVDTGAGIAPAHRDRLFQRFSQADSSINRQFGGTGLGLAICKRLAELMGGTIDFDSTVDQGSCFWFTIAAPLAEPPDDADAELPTSSAHHRILVVDDVAVNRELVVAILSTLGHALTEAAGGAEAVELALEQPFDLILMDLQMPGMDGLAATRAIRRGSPLNRDAPIIALTANVLPNHLQACIEAGMDDHIGKPIIVRELLAKIALWSERTEAGQISTA